jgi:hypothetical protein
MIEAMKQALEALTFRVSPDKELEAIAALRQAIEQAENPTHTDHPSRHWDRTCPACLAEAETQEPVDIHCPSCLHSFSIVPVAKPWVGLTDEDIRTLIYHNGHMTSSLVIETEAMLKERNT